MAAGYVNKYFVINNRVYYFDYLDSSGVYCAKQTTASNGVLSFNHKYYFPHISGTLLGTSGNGGIIWTNDGRGYLYGVKVDSNENVTEVLFTNASNATAVTSRLTGNNIKDYWPVCIDADTGTEVPSNTYTVVYDANGGTGAPASQTENYGYALYITTGQPTRGGYLFSGWNTSSDGSGTTYHANDYYYDNATSRTLYAQWAPYLDINGCLDGTGSGNLGDYGRVDVYINDVLEGSEVSDYYTAHAPGTSYRIEPRALPGYVYDGPVIFETYGNSTTTEGIMGTSPIYVCLSFKTGTFTLTFNANGGSVSESSRQVKYNEAYGLLPTPTRQGYNFTGWYTASTGGERHQGTNLMGSSNITLYAQWERAYSPIRLNIDGTYKKGWCWVNIQGDWKIGHPWVNVNNEWKSSK